MCPLDLSEFLQWLYMHACRHPGALCEGAADFALEALNGHENDCTAEYGEIREELEKLAGKDFDEDFRLVEYFSKRNGLLQDIEEKLGSFKFPDEFQKSDAADKVEYLLALIDDMQAELDALKAPVGVRPLEYDL